MAVIGDDMTKILLRQRRGVRAQSGALSDYTPDFSDWYERYRAWADGGGAGPPPPTLASVLGPQAAEAELKAAATAERVVPPEPEQSALPQPQIPDIPKPTDDDTTAAARIMATYGISAPLAAGIVRIARNVGAHPFDLANLINFESNFNPRLQYGNKTGNEPFNPKSATGLIQFIPSRAIEFGTTTRALREMTALQQLPYVEAYLKKVSGGRPLNTTQAVFMAVFQPSHMFVPIDTMFSPKAIAANPITDRAGRVTGYIDTPARYMAMALRKAAIPSLTVSPELMRAIQNVTRRAAGAATATGGGAAIGLGLLLILGAAYAASQRS